MKSTTLRVTSMPVLAGISLLLITAGLYGISDGWFGYSWKASTPQQTSRPTSIGTPQITSDAFGTTNSQQILFGDLHVHSTFSIDAFFMALPSAGGDGLHPISDACDFARYCSALDFFSMNDHAATLGPDRWQNTIDELRQCDNVTDRDNPDLIPFLGYEWTQAGANIKTHYGHKNVIFKSLAEDAIPTRPIAALSSPDATPPSLKANPFPIVGLAALAGGVDGLRTAAQVSGFRGLSECESGVPVRELPTDCLETAATPAELFAKLDDWQLDTIVIPHGTTWGMYTPPGSDWKKQLKGNQHNPNYQKLIEVFSGHGNSEEYRSYSSRGEDAAGNLICPAPNKDYIPACWQAAQITLQRCQQEYQDASQCEAIAKQAGIDFLLSSGNSGHRSIPPVAPDDWLEAGQCTDCWLPSFNYRPKGSAQYILALRDFSEPDNVKRFKLGFVASSDNHSARPGTGYKEVAREQQTEARFKFLPSVQIGSRFTQPKMTQDKVKSLAIMETPASPFNAWNFERAASWFLSGGLVAAHAEAKNRDSLWQALQDQHTYATSGPRMMLWFTKLKDANATMEDVMMGDEVFSQSNPTFKVRALGALEQKPGCPDFTQQTLGGDRINKLCNGECYYPSDVRTPIERIEVVRIKPQSYEGEPIENLIQDPWRSFECDSGDACEIEFTDEEYEAGQRDTVYYVRALQKATPVIGAEPLTCERDELGKCIKVISSCRQSTGDCLSETNHRAWSSPIYVNYQASASDT